MPRPATNILGQRFGRLTVVRRNGSSTRGAAQWLVQCDCGTMKTVRTDQLTTGNTVSCGCFRKENPPTKTHGLTNSFEFGCWSAMKYRCSSPNHKGYKHYGGRGISVCERWAHSFENFYADMGACPFPNGSIERINNDIGYNPDNCKWLPRNEQSKNRRNVKRGVA